MKKNLKNTIKLARIKSGLMQKQLAEELGISPSTIGMYEQGRRTPDYDILDKICRILKISVFDFFIENEVFDADIIFKYLIERLSSDSDVLLNGEALSDQKKSAIAYAIQLILSDK